MNLDELYQSISSFWSRISPIVIAHIVGLIAIRWIGGVRWHVLEWLEYRLETERYKRWGKILDQFALKPKIPYLILIGLFFYFSLFGGLLNLFAGFSPVSIVYSETEFWRENRPLRELTELGSYGNRADLHIWDIHQLKQNFAEELRAKYPERYRSLIGWVSDSYGEWASYYRLSLLFSVFVIVLCISHFKERRNREWRSFLRFFILSFLSICTILISRYEAEQYIEKQLQAEMHFVIGQLELDSQAQQNRLDDESIRQLEYQIYSDLKDTDQKAPELFWLSRVIEPWLPRAFPHISDEEFQQDYGYLESHNSSAP
jgi:hypothetical protein